MAPPAVLTLASVIDQLRRGAASVTLGICQGLITRNGDMLERAMMVGYRSNFRRDDELEFAFDMATAAAAEALGIEGYGIAVGHVADFVAVEAQSIAEAVATRPRRKLVMKGGRIVARDGVLVA